MLRLSRCSKYSIEEGEFKQDQPVILFKSLFVNMAYITTLRSSTRLISRPQKTTVPEWVQVNRQLIRRTLWHCEQSETYTWERRRRPSEEEGPIETLLTKRNPFHEGLGPTEIPDKDIQHVNTCITSYTKERHSGQVLGLLWVYTSVASLSLLLSLSL